jgi:PAS domain S-box-containing protein
MVLDDLTRAVEQTADSVLITNRNGIIEYVNPAFEAMTGYTRVEAIGRTPAVLRSGVQTPRFYASLWDTILSGRSFHTVVTNRTRDGRLFDEEETITPICDDSGGITHFVATGRDVTQARRADAARLHHDLEEEASRVATLMHAEVGQFLASALLSLADASRRVSPEVRSRLEDVRHCLGRVEEQLRSVARGRQPRPVGDLGLLDAVKFLAEECTRRTGVEISIESTLDRRCSAAVETLFYRFVRESLAHLARVTDGAPASIVLGRELTGRRAEDQTVSCSVFGEPVGPAARASLDEDDDAPDLRLVQACIEGVGGTVHRTTSASGGMELRATVPLGV